MLLKKIIDIFYDENKFSYWKKNLWIFLVPILYVLSEFYSPMPEQPLADIVLGALLLGSIFFMTRMMFYHKRFIAYDAFRLGMLLLFISFVSEVYY
ncbi:hypothetical protein [Thalassobacillus hwangdonensis]|uniref:Uncharacterized protein n=1 Tax=Thalassobacillus hwangdonensis TaxID=546108 RepID=A0ABW3L111_9BACI